MYISQIFTSTCLWWQQCAHTSAVVVFLALALAFFLSVNFDELKVIRISLVCGARSRDECVQYATRQFCETTEDEKKKIPTNLFAAIFSRIVMNCYAHLSLLPLMEALYGHRCGSHKFQFCKIIFAEISLKTEIIPDLAVDSAMRWEFESECG